MRTVLLYVRSPKPTHATDTAGMLEASRIPFDLCDDVYCALARLCRPDGDSILGVVVELDALYPDEFEFFTVARRNRPDVDVYFQTQRGVAAGVDEALSRGAAGRLTQQTLDALRRSYEDRAIVPPDASPADDPLSAEPSPAAGPPVSESIGSRMRLTENEGLPDEPVEREVEGTPAEPDAEDSPPKRESETGPPRPVRVPWGQRESTPARQAPMGHSDSGAASDGPSHSASPPPIEHDAFPEPLLTQDELRALMAEEPTPLVDPDPSTEPGASS